MSFINSLNIDAQYGCYYVQYIPGREFYNDKDLVLIPTYTIATRKEVDDALKTPPMGKLKFNNKNISMQAICDSREEVADAAEGFGGEIAEAAEGFGGEIAEAAEGDPVVKGKSKHTNKKKKKNRLAVATEAEEKEILLSPVVDVPVVDQKKLKDLGVNYSKAIASPVTMNDAIFYVKNNSIKIIARHDETDDKIIECYVDDLRVMAVLNFEKEQLVVKHNLRGTSNLESYAGVYFDGKITNEYKRNKVMTITIDMPPYASYNFTGIVTFCEFVDKNDLLSDHCC